MFCLFHISHTACKVYKITKCHCKQLSVTTVVLSYTTSNGRPNFMCAAFQPPKSMLTNILCLVRFGFGWNKLMQLLIRSRNSGGRAVRSLLLLLLLIWCDTVLERRWRRESRSCRDQRKIHVWLRCAAAITGISTVNASLLLMPASIKAHFLLFLLKACNTLPDVFVALEIC